MSGSSGNGNGQNNGQHRYPGIPTITVHAGHASVMSVADTGWGILFGRNPQEACDLALITRSAAETCQSPFMNVQDGFLITHTIENVLLPEKEFMEQYAGKPQDRIL